MWRGESVKIRINIASKINHGESRRAAKKKKKKKKKKEQEEKKNYRSVKKKIGEKWARITRVQFVSPF